MPPRRRPNLKEQEVKRRDSDRVGLASILSRVRRTGYADNHARHRNRCDGSRGRAAEMTMHDQTRALLPRCWKRAIASWSSSTNFAPSSIGIAAAKPRTLALPHRAQHRHGFSQTIRAKKHGACSRRSGAPRVSTTSVYCDRRPFLANRVTHARNQSSASRHFCDAQTTR